jgi:hypothetical protein
MKVNDGPFYWKPFLTHATFNERTTALFNESFLTFFSKKGLTHDYK